jgi:hypothetical protein
MNPWISSASVPGGARGREIGGFSTSTREALMKRLVLFAGIMMIWASVAIAGDAETISYGDGVSLSEAVPIPQLLAEADDYVGEKVRVDGVITGVCKKRGCWMQLTDPETGQGVRIKVEDGVIVFPYTAMGHRGSAEGIFEAVKLTPEQVEAREAQRHAKHEDGAGEPCEKETPARAAGCDAPVQEDTIYLIRGTGAVIES